jgi:hypothetical protein
MARIRRQLFPRNLIKYDVLIDDTSPNSDYFRISQLPEVFSAGKNSFLIGASPYLKPRSKILIELINVNGETVYNTVVPVNSEANARIVSVEVYENTTPGPYKLVVLGETSIIKSSNTTVGDEWAGVYNVRWVRDIKVEPKLKNTSPIRFIREPEIAEISEEILSIPSSSYAEITQPIDVKLYAIYESGLVRGYTIYTSGSYTFNRKHIGGTISASVTYYHSGYQITSQSQFELPITDVINQTTAISDGIPLWVNEIAVERLDLFNNEPYTSSLFNVTSSIVNLIYDDYNKSSTILDTGSFAKIRIVDLETYSGEVDRIEVFAKPIDDAGDFKLITKPTVEVPELLVTSSQFGDEPIGTFYSESFSKVTNNWYSNVLPSSSSPLYPINSTPSYLSSSFSSSQHLSLIPTSEKILDSIYAQVPTVGSYFSSSVEAYFIGTKNSYEVFESSEYTLFFDAFYTKTSGSVTVAYPSGTLDVYLIGSGSSVISDDYLGQKIATLTTNISDQHNFVNQEFNFEPRISVSGYVGVRFVARGGFWHIANVSIKPSTEFSFNPDETVLYIPIIDYADKLLIFKTKYFDINNNSAYIETVSIPEFFSGSRTSQTLGNINGSGTPGYLPKWNTSSTLHDSIVSQSGTVIGVAGSFVVKGGQAYTERYNGGIASGSLTINWDNGNHQKYVLNGNTNVTFSNGKPGSVYSLEIVYSGSYSASWDSSVEWPGDFLPVQTQTLNKKDIFTFFCNGSVYNGQTFGLNYSDTN